MASTEQSTTPQNGNSSSFQIPQNILDDLCSRFIINIPGEERQDLIRIFFQIELAHWFYLDFYCQEKPELKACGIKEFSTHIFRHCPTLRQHADNVDKIMETWKEYKMAVPTYGAIMLDSQLQHCLLVQGFWSRASWGFPKGKVNEGEEAEFCAIREVFEETGYDITALLDKEEYIEYKMNGQLSRLYIVPSVSMETKFSPRTRKEIKNLEWFKVDHLPSHKKDLVCKQQYGLNPNSFFMVIPFIRSLKKWIARRQGRTPDLNDSDQNSNGIYGKPGRLHDRSGGKKSRERDPRATGGERDGSATRAHTLEKQKLKQQQQFSQPILAEYQDYLRHKENAAGSQRNKGASGSAKEQRTRSASPRQGSGKKQQYQIMKRDGTTSSGPGKRALDFEDEPRHGRGKSRGSSKQPASNEPFFSDSWANFRLDADAILLAFLPEPQKGKGVR